MQKSSIHEQSDQNKLNITFIFIQIMMQITKTSIC